MPLESRQPLIVLYDDACPMCSTLSRYLHALDWFHTLALTPMSQAIELAARHGIRPEALHEAMHAVGPDGAVYRGEYCIRHLSLRVPVLVPVALLLWIPGMIWVAAKVYHRVSRNRFLISRLFGCKGGCALP